METIGLIYEITGNPYFEDYSKLPDRISEYVYPSEISDICQAFIQLGYQYEIIDGANDLLKRTVEIKEKCSVLFNKSIGFKGLERKITVPALGYLYKLPLLGSSAYAMTLARHKYHTNRLLSGMGFLTPVSEILYSFETPITISKFPVIVKPNAESDSLGISEDSVCNSMEQVKTKVKKIAETFGYPLIIEQFIPGEELKVCVIGNSEYVDAPGCVSVIKKGKSIAGSLQTREDILTNSISHTSVLNLKLSETVKFLAKNIHIGMELRDYSRIDFRVGDNEKIYCMEVSTHPDISKEGSSFITAALQSFNSYSDIIQAIIKSCKQRLLL